MIAVDLHVCPACRGAQVLGHDDESGRALPCDHCDGSGRVVTCLNAEGDNRHCRRTLPAPEAETEGAFCASCRKMLDVSDFHIEAAQ